MKNNMTELVFVLDRSGSMGGLETETINGFNGMLEKQRAENESINVTTVLFDDKVDIIHDRFPISIVAPLTGQDFYVRGCTALLDALGQAIHKVENIQNHLPDGYRAGKVIFVITTDGLENSSREYSYGEIKQMILDKRAIGWEFLFLGANMDAVGEAQKIGIERNRAVTYDNSPEGVALNYEVVGNTVRKAVSMDNKDSPLIDDGWADKIKNAK